MKTAFRTDASRAIGTGHLFRCLTLAKGLRDQGAKVAFVCRDLPGNVNVMIRDCGFDLHLLAAPDAPFASAPGAPAHAGWAGVGADRDAAETRALLNDIAPDWLVLDHYAFDARWEQAALPPDTRLAVLDDLADRAHDCDLLLDQNLGRQSTDYDTLLPPRATRMIGPHHALLRPEFARLRPAALKQRANRNGRLCDVLVTMGGVDQPNATGKVLSALARWPGAAGLCVDVVLGCNAPALQEVRDMAPRLPFPCTVSVDVPDMAARMARADLAIGAVGGTAWERCCLGLATLMVVLADNQSGAARALHDAGAGVLLGRAKAANLPEHLHRALNDLSAPGRLTRISEAAAQVCDGGGTGHLINTMRGTQKA